MHHQTAASDVRKMYAELLPSIITKLQNQTAEWLQKVNLTLDAWTSGNKILYLGITCHWMDKNFDMQDCVIGFKRLKGSHAAENLCDVVVQTLREFNLLKGIRCMIADNASVNTRLLKLPENHLPVGIGKTDMLGVWDT